MYCPRCNAITDVSPCPQCGRQRLDVLPPRPKDPGVAAVLSTVLPGLGQLYAERLMAGLLLLFLYATSLFLTVLVGIERSFGPPESSSLFSIVAILALIFWLTGLLDAYYTTREQQAKLANIKKISATSSIPQE